MKADRDWQFEQHVAAVVLVASYHLECSNAGPHSSVIACARAIYRTTAFLFGNQYKYRGDDEQDRMNAVQKQALLRILQSGPVPLPKSGD